MPLLRIYHDIHEKFVLFQIFDLEKKSLISCESFAKKIRCIDKFSKREREREIKEIELNFNFISKEIRI